MHPGRRLHPGGPGGPHRQKCRVNQVVLDGRGRGGGPGRAGRPRRRDAARPGSVTARGGNLSYHLAGGPAILAGRADGLRGDGCRGDGRGDLDATPGKMDPAKLPSVWRNRFRFRYRPKCRARPTSGPLSIDQVQGLDVASMPARVHVFTTRRGSPRFTIRPAVDRPGAGPRRGHHAGTCSRVHNAAGISTLHHPARCRSTGCRASTWPPCRHVVTCSQRGGDLHASPSGPLSIDQVQGKRRPRPWFDHAGSAGSSWTWPAHARRLQLETRGLSPLPGHPPRL